MSKIIKSHFYIVKGRMIHHPNIQRGWTFHSYMPLEQFAPLVADLVPEYNIEILETYFNESEIIETWEIK